MDNEISITIRLPKALVDLLDKQGVGNIALSIEEQGGIRPDSSETSEQSETATPAPTTAPEPTPTLPEINALLKEANKVFSRSEIVDILKAFGASKLVELPADRYSTFYKHVQDLINNKIKEHATA